MAAIATLRTFWGALLSVLLKCIAALGFTTAATCRQATAARPADTAGATNGAVVPTTGAVPAARTAGSPGDSAPAAERPERETWRVPSPRAYESPRSGRVLPPTMKQRINAEAHGSTPAGRSLPAGTLLTHDGYGGVMTVPEPDAGERHARKAAHALNGGHAANTAQAPAETAGLRA